MGKSVKTNCSQDISSKQPGFIFVCFVAPDKFDSVENCENPWSISKNTEFIPLKLVTANTSHCLPQVNRATSQ